MCIIPRMTSNYEARPIPAETPKARARFMGKISKNTPTGCWDWIGGTRAPGGYGVFSLACLDYRAHRVIFAWTHGDTVAEIHHKCGNTGCVNPDHLEAAVNGQPYHRGPRATHCSKGHEFTLTKAGRRECRICAREKSNRYREQNREKVLARRRELRIHVVHEPRPCMTCDKDFVPERVDARMCLECRSGPNDYRRAYMRDYMRKRRAKE